MQKMFKKIGVICLSVTLLLSQRNYVSATTEEDFDTIPTVSYGGHTYQLYLEHKSWNDAKEYCESLGGHLVTITSYQEQETIASYIDKYAGDYDIWIGINDVENEGDWSTWITGEKVTYTNWGVCEPDNYNGTQNYGAICNGTRNGSTYSIAKGQWDDLEDNDSTVSGYFICEWDSGETIDNNGFQIGKDNNKYLHGSSSDMGFDGVKDYHIDDVYFEYLVRNASKSEINMLKVDSDSNNENGIDGGQMNQKWEGSCYGIAMTMGLLFDNYISINDLSDSKAACYYDLPNPCEDPKLLNLINYYQLSQFLEDGGKESGAIASAINENIFERLYNRVFGDQDLKSFLKTLVEVSLDNNNGRLLGFSNEEGGHAVLVTGCYYDNAENCYKVQIYDENSVNGICESGKFSYMTVSSDFTNFSYADSNGEFGKRTDYGKVQYIDNSTYSSIYLLDFSKVNHIIFKPYSKHNLKKFSSSAKIEDEYTYIRFPFGITFSLSNNNGEKMIFDGKELSGDMAVYDINTYEQDNQVYLKLKIDNSKKFYLDDISEDFSLQIYNKNDFKALFLNGADSAEISLKNDVKVHGSNAYQFKIFTSTDQKVSENESGLIAVCAEAKGQTSINKNGTDLSVEADEKMSNIQISSYADNDKATERYEDSSSLYFDSTKIDEGQTKPYKIVVPTVSKVKSVKAMAGKKKLAIKWKKASGVAGYQIQVSTKSSFKGAKTVHLKKSKISYTAKKLESKKKYYVRIRTCKTYKDANGKTKKVYGKWVKISKKTK